MIRIIGQNGCSACLMAKNVLTNKQVEFSYELLEDMDKQSSEEVLNLARKNAMLSMPIIIKDNKQLTLQELLLEV